MSSEALFGLSVLMSFIAFGIVTELYIWPKLWGLRREDVLIPLVVPHTFRFVGLSFLIPGVRISHAFSGVRYSGSVWSCRGSPPRTKS